MEWFRHAIRDFFYPSLPPDPVGDLSFKVDEHFDRLRMLENMVNINDAVLETVMEALCRADGTRDVMVTMAQVLEAKAAEWEERIEDRAAAFFSDDEVQEPAAAMAGGLELWAMRLRMMARHNAT